MIFILLTVIEVWMQWVPPVTFFVLSLHTALCPCGYSASRQVALLSWFKYVNTFIYQARSKNIIVSDKCLIVKVMKDDGWKKLRVGLHLDEQGLVEYNYLTHCIYTSMNVRKMKFIMKYLHLPLTFLRWTISDQQASYSDEGQLIMWQQFVRRNDRKIKCKYKS